MIEKIDFVGAINLKSLAFEADCFRRWEGV